MTFENTVIITGDVGSHRGILLSKINKFLADSGYEVTRFTVTEKTDEFRIKTKLTTQGI